MEWMLALALFGHCTDEPAEPFVLWKMLVVLAMAGFALYMASRE